LGQTVLAKRTPKRFDAAAGDMLDFKQLVFGDCCRHMLDARIVP
jgi:hypothetical protein